MNATTIKTGKMPLFPLTEIALNSTKTLPQSKESCNTLTSLISHAWMQAVKYRHDPFIGPIHQEYLDLLKTLAETT